MHIPHESQRSRMNTSCFGLHVTSMIMQYLLHFGQLVFICTSIAFLGHDSTHLLQEVHRLKSITGNPEFFLMVADISTCYECTGKEFFYRVFRIIR